MNEQVEMELWGAGSPLLGMVAWGTGSPLLGMVAFLERVLKASRYFP